MVGKSSKDVRHVALAYPIAVPWMAVFADGVADYAKRRGGWTFTVSPPLLDSAAEAPLTLQSLSKWPGDGVIAAVFSAADMRAAKRLRKPVVNIASTSPSIGLPSVMSDNYRMGVIAAEHLLQRGLRRLAYFGIEGLWYSSQRCQGFIDTAEQAGASCDVLNVPRSARLTWQERISPLTRWLRRLRPPFGLLAIQDYRARSVIDECERLGWNVPHDVAVMGVDNDPTICEFSRPTLTSVSRDPWRLGYEAAALLDRLMAGKNPPAEGILVPPEGVIARQSTDTVAVENPHVADAIHYIHDHLSEPFGVESAVQATSISRRQLEVQFRRVLGCTLHDYICRQRCERAKELLDAKHPVKLHALAKSCGFSSVQHMRLVFTRLLGITPRGYRGRRHAASIAAAKGESAEGLPAGLPAKQRRSRSNS